MRSAFFLIGLSAVVLILAFVVFSFTGLPRPSNDTRDLLKHLNTSSGVDKEASGPHIP